MAIIHMYKIESYSISYISFTNSKYLEKSKAIQKSKQKDLKFDLYWNGKRVDRHIRKFIDNLCKSILEASWSFNHTYRTIFQDVIHIIKEKVTWALFKKNTEFNYTTTSVNNNFIKYLKFTNNLLSTLKIMKKRKYDLYGDVKCRLCLVENKDDDHIIYCQQLRDKWLMVTNNTIYKCEQILKDFLLQKKKYFQLNQKDTTQLYLWNKNFFVHITGFNQELPIPFVYLMLRNFFSKGTQIIWQLRCNLVAECEHIKEIKKQDLRKKY
ncbi:hypothetical protein RhiirA4_479241 [Rhizophagus irregularis]|uniref:Uncharacterized protein n=1 Tax=Rhizophagus irregularis TaxID=588596 RepID=A0A2I1HG54_9GLOM|nr:hypothetical protein RhiirA4_479241 [Rhizophagus irregularis]